MDIKNPLFETIDLLQDRIRSLRKSVAPDERIIIAFAGVPGSGKSTIAAALLAQLQHAGINDVAIVPMDGFHLTKAQLGSRPNSEEAFRRRGAPFTFDGEAFVATAETLRKNHCSQDIGLPNFDHGIQDPVENEITIRSKTKVVILEGNYTLLDLDPWNRIANIAHERWFVDVARGVAKTRLAKRHLLAGIESDIEAAEARAELNDLKNGDLIKLHLIRPHVTICS